MQTTIANTKGEEEEEEKLAKSSLFGYWFRGKKSESAQCE